MNTNQNKLAQIAAMRFVIDLSRFTNELSKQLQKPSRASRANVCHM